VKIAKRAGGRNYHCDIWTGTERIRQSLHTSEYSLALARAHELARNAKARSGRPAGGIPLADFTKRYVEWAWETKPSSAKTEGYRADIILQWLKDQGVVRLEDVTAYHVEQFRAWIRERDRRRKPDENGKQGASTKSTANRYCAQLRTMFNRAADWQVYDGPNPVKRVKFYRENNKAKPVEVAELKAVLVAARTISAQNWSPAQKAIADLIEFGVNTGLRLHELLSLKWRQIRDDTLDITGKGDKSRTIPLNAKSRAILARQPQRGEFVWDIPNRASQAVLRKTIVRVRKLSGVAHFHMHLTRHYFMTALLAAGVDLQTIADLMGHSRITTALIYAHGSPERRRAAVDRLVEL
jgi:site-specific recombinase XerD